MDEPLIIRVEHPNDIQRLAWTDLDARPYNSPISHLVHSELAKYYLDITNTPSLTPSKELEQWMQLISHLNEAFYDLEKLINHPISANPKQAIAELIGQITAWKDRIVLLIENHISASPRINHLKCSLHKKIFAHTEALCIRIRKIEIQNHISQNEIRYLHAPHDLSFFTPSLGRWLSEQMHLILQTGLRGAYHLTPTPWYNIIQVHPSIAALSNAKKQVSLKSFALLGISHTSPFHAHDEQFFASKLDQAYFKINRNNAFEAERWVSLREGKPLEDIHYSAAFSLLIPRILAILAFELPFLLIRLTVHCLNALSILLLCGYIPKFIIEIENQLTQFHHDYSPITALQNIENNWQQTHWRNNVSAESLKILIEAQNHFNVFSHFADFTQSHPYWQRLNQLWHEWLQPKQDIFTTSPSVKTMTQYLKIRANLINVENETPCIQHTAHNRLETAVDLIEEIAMVLDNQTIDALFRTNPGPALGFFNLAMFGYISLLTPALIPAQLKTLQAVMHLILDKLCHQFMGHAVTENYANIQLSSFLFWQLSFYGTKLGIDLSDKQQRIWYQELAQYPDSFVLISMIVVGLGIMEAYLPSIPNTILNIPNPLAIFYNTINHEAAVCLRHGTAPANLTSLAIISVKSIGLYMNLIAGQEFTSEVLNFIHQFFFHPEFLIALHTHLEEHDSEENHETFIANFCQTHQLTAIDGNTVTTLSQLIEAQFNKKPSENPELLDILYALKQQDIILSQALHNKTFACEMAEHLNRLFDDYNTKHPHAPLDKSAFLNQFYSTYCQLRIMNLLRLLEIALLPFHLICWAMGAATNSMLWTEYGRKSTTEDAFIIAKLCYSLIHPLAQFILIAYNYAFLNTLRAIPFVLRICLENLFGQTYIETFSIYQALHHIDDFLQSFKIHYTMNQLLWPLQVLFANLSYYSGRFLDMPALSQLFIEKILAEQNPVEIVDKNIYNRQSNEDNNNYQGVQKNVRF